MKDLLFEHLCSHYKYTYEVHLASIKQRDYLFYFLLVILSLFTLQINASCFVNEALYSYLDKKLNLIIDKNPVFFGLLLWFLLFGLSLKYYQIVIQIERQYIYLHSLEEEINKQYSLKSIAFTREGKSYLHQYPLFSDWIYFLYIAVFPMILMVCIILRMQQDCRNLAFDSFPFWMSLSLYFLIGITTTLYVLFMNREKIKKVCNFFHHKR